MASYTDKNEFNATGKYYVDTQCIACEVCLKEAPTFFSMNDNFVCAFVSKQPQNKHDIGLCETVLELCPVEAIGNNGK